MVVPGVSGGGHGKVHREIQGLEGPRIAPKAKLRSGWYGSLFVGFRLLVHKLFTENFTVSLPLFYQNFTGILPFLYHFCLEDVVQEKVIIH
jgi:hypothetical protein